MNEPNGSFDAAAILDRIAHVKLKEKELTLSIRQNIPDLEASYVELMQQWEQVFERTEQLAEQWKEDISSSTRYDASFLNKLQAMETEAGHQTYELIRQLAAFPQFSQAVQKNESAKAMIYQMIQSYNQGEFRQAESTWSQPVPDQAPVPIGGHTLPPLPYAYNALEPYIDETTMKLHHDKHHLSYVNGLNKAEKMLEQARQQNDFDLIKHWEREAAFNGAGHYLHTIFWNIMSPNGGGKPTGPIAKQIEQDFGSFDAFKNQFSAAADKVEGSGWAILVWSPRSHRLAILQAEKHQNLSQWDVIPLLVLDVWEHAYYLKYQNERKRYIEAWWNVVNWNHVNERFSKARQLKWYPY